MTLGRLGLGGDSCTRPRFLPSDVESDEVLSMTSIGGLLEVSSVMSSLSSPNNERAANLLWLNISGCALCFQNPSESWGDLVYTLEWSEDAIIDKD